MLFLPSSGLAVPGAILWVNVPHATVGFDFGFNTLTVTIEARSGYYALIVNCINKNTLTITRGSSSQKIGSGGAKALVGDTPLLSIPMQIGANDVSDYDFVVVHFSIDAYADMTFTIE